MDIGITESEFSATESLKRQFENMYLLHCSKPAHFSFYAITSTLCPDITVKLDTVR
jgi:hypothetical protein